MASKKQKKSEIEELEKKLKRRRIDDLEDARRWAGSVDFRDAEDLLSFLFAIISGDVSHILADAGKIMLEEGTMDESDELITDALMVLLDLNKDQVPANLRDKWSMIVEGCAAVGISPLAAATGKIAPLNPQQKMIHDLADQVPVPDHGGYQNQREPPAPVIREEKRADDGLGL